MEVISRFVTILSERDGVSSVDQWGNGYLHALCSNPKVAVNVLEGLVLMLPSQCVLRRNGLRLLPIQYIEAIHCYPTQCMVRLEAMMETARNLEITEIDADSGGVSDIKMTETKVEDDAVDGDGSGSETKEDFDVDPTEKKTVRESKGERQRRLLAMKWYFGCRAMKPIGGTELFMDSVETLDVVINAKGQISWFQVRGIMMLRCTSTSQRVVHLLTNDLRNWRCGQRTVKQLQSRSTSMRCVHLEAVAFDPAVNVNTWTRRRQIAVSPPRGSRIVAMSYRMTRKYLDFHCIPFRCFCDIRYLDSLRSVHCKITFQNHDNVMCAAPRYTAKVTVPLIPSKGGDIGNVMNSDGAVEVMEDSLIWSIGNVQQREPMVLEFDILNVDHRGVLDEWLLNEEIMQRPRVRVQFRFVSDHLFSGFNVEGYSAYDLDGKEADSLEIWKRKQALSGLCFVEMA